MLALRLAVSLFAVLTLGDFSTAAAAPAMSPLGSVTARSANAAGPPPPAAIQSPWNIVPPVLDGTIGATEWANATTLDITLGGTPIIAYVMNDAGFLYLAFDDHNFRRHTLLARALAGNFGQHMG